MWAVRRKRRQCIGTVEDHLKTLRTASSECAHSGQPQRAGSGQRRGRVEQHLGDPVLRRELGEKAAHSLLVLCGCRECIRPVQPVRTSHPCGGEGLTHALGSGFGPVNVLCPASLTGGAGKSTLTCSGIAMPASTASMYCASRGRAPINMSERLRVRMYCSPWLKASQPSWCRSTLMIAILGAPGFAAHSAKYCSTTSTANPLDTGDRLRGRARPQQWQSDLRHRPEGPGSQ